MMPFIKNNNFSGTNNNIVAKHQTNTRDVGSGAGIQSLSDLASDSHIITVLRFGKLRPHPTLVLNWNYKKTVWEEPDARRRERS